MISAARKWIHARALWSPKSGHSSHEYEDAFAVSGLDTVHAPADARTFRAAVADGATEAAFSRSWANRLTAAFVQSGDVESSMPALRQSFRSRSQRRLPWYLEAKLEEGAHAAMLGLEIQAHGTVRTWKAAAVGDCCLFHVPSTGRPFSWPLDATDTFTHTPDLISSAAADPLPSFLEASGTWHPGDAFILATDALAAWLISTGPAALLTAENRFDELVLEARADGLMRDDDVTAVIVDLR